MGEKNEHVCPVEKAGGLDSGIRKLLQRPKKILGNYAREGMTVLDLGCGPGFFSVEMAKEIGFKPVERPKVFLSRAVVFRIWIF